MGLMIRKFTSEDIKKAEEGMRECPFCGSSKVKVTTVSKGSNKGDKVQGMCNVCYSRGPAVADDPYKAVELWNIRLLYEYSDSDLLVLDDKQMESFINGEILLNTRSQIEFDSVLKYCKGKIENCKPVEWHYLWGDYKEDTVLNAKSSLINSMMSWLGYSNKQYYLKQNNKKIEEVKVIKRLAFNKKL